MVRMFPRRAMSRSSRFVALLTAVALLGLGLAGCGKDDDPAAPEPPVNTGFTLGYELANWQSSGITDGTTSMALKAGTREEEADFAYSVHRSSGGVSYRTTTFSVPATKSGTVTVTWTYTGYHAFFLTSAELSFFADQGGGADPQIVTAVESQPVPGGFTFSGTTTLNVVEGEAFGFTMGGDNFDSDSHLQGNLNITKFKTPL